MSSKLRERCWFKQYGFSFIYIYIYITPKILEATCGPRAACLTCLLCCLLLCIPDPINLWHANQPKALVLRKSYNMFLFFYGGSARFRSCSPLSFSSNPILPCCCLPFPCLEQIYEIPPSSSSSLTPGFPTGLVANKRIVYLFYVASQL
jgi:hypothetical protein